MEAGKEYYTAMLAARLAMGPLIKNSLNPFTKSKYADLSAVMDVIEKPLLEAGILVEQFPTVRDGSLEIDTVLTHAETAQQVVHTLPFPLGKIDAQGIGTAITYARRYALTAIFGLAQEDDDGNGASQARLQPQRQAAPPPPPPSNGIEEPDIEMMTDEKHAVVSEWITPSDAQHWAVAIGACANEHEARNSLKKIVNEHCGGKLTKANSRLALSLYYDRQLEKLSAAEPAFGE